MPSQSSSSPPAPRSMRRTVGVGKPQELVAIFVGLWGDARQGELSEVGKVMNKMFDETWFLLNLFRRYLLEIPVNPYFSYFHSA